MLRMRLPPRLSRYVCTMIEADLQGRASKQSKKRNIVQEQKKRDRIVGIESYPQVYQLTV